MHHPVNFSALCFAFLASTFWVQPRPASACSPSPLGIHQRSSYPASGAVGVPTNTRIVVTYDWSDNFTQPPLAPGLGVTLRKSGGPAVPASVSTLMTSPSASPRKRHLLIDLQVALEANTAYEIVDHHPVIPCYPQSDTICESAGVTVFATFTTGAGPDTVAPRFDGLKAVSGREMPTICESSACCGPYVSRELTLEWDAATDEGANDAVAYNIYRDGALYIPLVAGSTLAGVQSCVGGSSQGPPLPPGTYVVRAVDWAGNEDMNSSVREVSDLCASVAGPTDGAADGGRSPDSSVTPESGFPSPDATTGTDANGPRQAEDTSCSCRMGGASSAPSWFANVVFGALWLGWRRRSLRTRR